jgi:hypothetical protein
MGKNVVVIGTQWGDEGKGKLVELLLEYLLLPVSLFLSATLLVITPRHCQLNIVRFHARPPKGLSGESSFCHR